MTQLTIGVFATPDCRPRATRLAEMIGGNHVVKTIWGGVTYAQQVLAFAKKYNFDAVIITDAALLSPMLSLLPDFIHPRNKNGSEKTLSMNDYHGSFIKYKKEWFGGTKDVDVLFLNTLDMLVKLDPAPTIYKRHISKITKPGNWFPQTDFTWETNYAKPVKAAAWVRLTEESIKDVVGLQSVANDLLVKKHAIKKAKGILYGDGISPNPKGATTYGRVFSAGALALAVTSPNFMDVVNAAITDIATTHNFEDEMPYIANLVMVNPNDFYIQMVSAKDLNGLPLYPQASLFNQVVIGGVTIKPEETIPAGKIFVADMSKYNTTNYVPYSVRIGWVNDDFIKNQFVVLAESRFHAFVKKLDAQAFIYDDIATIKTAITKA